MVRLVALVLVAVLAGCRCGGDGEGGAELPSASPAPAAALAPVDLPARPPRHLVIAHGSQLEGAELGSIESLDLALAESDRLGQLAELDAASVCAGIDLGAVARRAPALHTLRISGCGGLLSGLGAARGLRSLTLSELELDAAAVAQLAALEGLTALTLVRVTVPETVELDALGKLGLHEITLHDLERDSRLAHLLDLWPRSLVRATLSGSWAGHDAMTQLAKAQALERLELRDTRVGNFSLNQIKPLTKLREVVWSGDTFNDNSALYFRDLAVTHFTCDCPRFGDGGLHTLRHCASIERLELPRSQITGAGLGALTKLPELRELLIGDRDIGQAGLGALAAVPKLRRLELSGTAAQPSMPGLGALVHLEQLRVHYPELDDRAAAEIGRMVPLRDLDLARTRISDVGLAHFASLVNLQSLALSHTRVTNRGLSALSGLTQLRALHLDHTDVVDAATQHIAPLHGLQTLRLDHTLVTDASIDALLGLTALVRLDVSGTVITPEGLARLQTLPHLTELVGGRADAVAPIPPAQDEVEAGTGDAG